MATTLIFPHQNTQTLSATFYDGTSGFVGGLCCGYSIAWAKRFLRGNDLADTVPNATTARTLTTVMSAYAEVHGNSTVDMVVNAARYHNLRVVGRSVLQRGWDLVMFAPHEFNSVYLLCTVNHVVAFGRFSGPYYYFDANFGLYRCENWVDLLTHLQGEPNIAQWLQNPQSFMLQLVIN